MTQNPARRGSPTAPEKIACPYCGDAAAFLPTSELIYHGRDYGPVYVCLPCRAWVGCHRGTSKPLGRLADATLRRAKIAAHEAFDRVWRAYHIERTREDPAYPPGRTRARAYKRLAEALALEPGACHIGLFDVEACHNVVQLCDRGALTLD